MKKLKKKPFVIGLPPSKRYIVALTERYETETFATSREEAIERVTEHGGNGPAIMAMPKSVRCFYTFSN
jgi:hypothetical protein